jgi:drug/metabolite transporter (DMT)-like permease
MASSVGALGIPRWIWGVSMNIFGQIMINFGTNVMKYGHGLSAESNLTHVDSLQSMDGYGGEPVAGHRFSVDDYDLTETDFSDDDDPNSTSKNKRKSSRAKWMKRVGSLLFITGGILNFISMGFAAQSLIASLGSVQFLSNVIFGKFVLSETVTRRTWLATVVICTGNLMIVYNSNRSSKEFTAKQLFYAYAGEYKFYVTACVCALVITQLAYNALTVSIRRHANKSLPAPKWIETTQALCYALFSAIIGTQSMLQAKCMSELLRMTSTGSNQMSNPFTYGVVFVYIITTVFWLYRMNYALQQYDGLFIIPILQVFWLVFTITSGGIYFGEFTTFTPQQMFGFVSGVLVLFIGVYLLMPTEDPEQFSEMDDDGEFPEHGIDIDVEIHEDFNGKHRGSSDPKRPVDNYAVPEGLPPLGDGIGGGEDSPSRRSSDNARERKSSGDARHSSFSRSKNRVAAFGHYDETRKDRARLMSFGFMPVVSYDRRLVKMTDWTIERRKYLKPLSIAGKKMAKWVPVNLRRMSQLKDGTDKGIELGDELRRRTLTQDGVVDIRSGRLVGGKDVDIRKIGAEWERERKAKEESLLSPNTSRNSGGGKTVGVNFARDYEHRRSFSQPHESISKMVLEGSSSSDAQTPDMKAMAVGVSQVNGPGGLRRASGEKGSGEFGTEEEIGEILRKERSEDLSTNTNYDEGEMDSLEGIEEGRESVATVDFSEDGGEDELEGLQRKGDGNDDNEN